MADVTIRLDELEELEALYTKADAEGKESFQFKGETWLTEYAKYILQFLKSKMKLDE